jgi:hypothetical protein
MTLEQLLREVRRQRLILQLLPGRVTLWHPHQRVPLETIAAIVQHNASLQRLVASCDVRVCYNAGLHRKYWRYLGNGRFTCEMCERLNRSAA